MAEMFELKIIEPDGMFYEGQASFLEFASVMGEMGVYANHIPLTTILTPGVVKIHNDGQVKKAAVMGGFIEIQNTFVQGYFLLVKVFRAVAAHIGSGFAIVLENPLCDAPKANNSRQIKEKHGVAVLQPMGEGAVKVAVHDPAFLLQLRIQFFIEFFPGNVLPSLLPPELIQMYNIHSQFLSQGAGQGGLSAAGAANHQNPFQIKPPS